MKIKNQSLKNHRPSSTSCKTRAHEVVLSKLIVILLCGVPYLHHILDVHPSASSSLMEYSVPESLC